MTLPPFEDDSSEALKEELAHTRDAVRIGELLSFAEHEWDVRWLRYIDRVAVSRVWREENLLSRWLNHEAAQGNFGAAYPLAVVLRSQLDKVKADADVCEALCRYYFATDNLQEATLFFERFTHLDPDADFFWCDKEQLDYLIRHGKYDEAQDQLASLCQNEAELSRPKIKLIAISAANMGDLTTVSQLLELLGISQIEDEYLAYLYFTDRLLTGQFHLGSTEFLDYIERFPSHYLNYQVGRVLCQKAGVYDAYAAFVQLALADANEYRAIEILGILYVDQGDQEAALQIGNRLAHEKSEPKFRFELSYEIAFGTTQKVKRAYEAYCAADFGHVGPQIQFASYLLENSIGKNDLRQAKLVLLEVEKKGMSNLSYVRLLLEVEIALGEVTEAEARFENLPDYQRSNASMSDFDIYFAARRGSDDKAKQMWSERLATYDYKCVRSPSDDAAPVRLNYRNDAGRKEVLLFLCVFNAVEYIDWFVSYYRKLGVDHFFIVDNGSTDGTAEKFVVYENVSLFQQDGSFDDSGHGVKWINSLIQTYGRGHWCFFLDMDEAFVFPGMDNGRSLAELLADAERANGECFSSYMLDVFPLARMAGTSTFADNKYFDNQYFAFPWHKPPYWKVQGGVRRRLTGRNILITKSPLVKVDEGFHYLENNHTHTHLRPACETTALLHYKFVGNAAERFDEAIERGEHFMGARLYRELRGTGAGERITRSWRTRSNPTARKLDRLGLISKSVNNGFSAR